MSRKHAIAPKDVPPIAGGAGCPVDEVDLCQTFVQFAGENGIADLQAQDHVAAARRAICRENETLDGVPVICKGWAASMLTITDGRRQILSFLLPGDIASTVLIFDPICRCTVEAITELHYRSFARETVRALMLRHPGLVRIMADIHDKEMAHGAQLAAGLGKRTAAERIALLILHLSERLARRGMMQGLTMDFPLRQHHVADATGLTVVHAGNMLSEFRRAGLIEISDRSLTLHDADGLRRIAGLL